MALTHKLEIRQGQQLVMTPQLQQAIKLLQLSNLDLVSYVETELERNPLLERAENGDPAERRGLETVEEPRNEASDATSSDAWLDLATPRTDAGAALDTDFENVYPDMSKAELGGSTSEATPFADRPLGLGAESWTAMRGSGGSFDGDDVDLEAYATAELSLRDHLAEQVQIAIPDPVERIVAGFLVDVVDEAGYISADLTQLAERLGAPVKLVERVLAKFQTFDPPGVAARSLSECLALQLKELNRYDPVIARLLDNLPLLAAHDLAGLKRAVGIDMDELSDMISEIKHLNPKPGLKFGSVQVQPVVPDVIVRAASDGSWLIELNSETLPRVLVNRGYYAKVSKTATATKDRDYLVDCLQTANWLVKSLDQRARTILKVAEEIVRQQDGFFTYGVQHLRPLNLKTVADAISMHESTVSRVTSNKYMATPRGIFELKYFFTSAIASAADGEAYSSEAVRHRISQLIEARIGAAVLSDDTIVDLLKREGIDIARRTVAKYREAMRIPSSVQRRREKRMEARMASAV